MSEWKLIVSHPKHGTKEFELLAGRAYSIGRSDCDVTIDFEPFASRRHASVEWSGQNWSIVDELSANGTKVDGKPVNVAQMTSGVVAMIGETSLEVRNARQAAVAPPPRPNAEPASAPSRGGHPGRSAAPSASAAPAQPAPRRANPAAVTANASANYGPLIAVGVVVLVGVLMIVIASSGGGSRNTEADQPTRPIKPLFEPKPSTNMAPVVQRTPEQWLTLLEADSDPARAYEDLALFNATHGKDLPTGLKARVVRLTNELEGKLRGFVVNTQRSADANIIQALADREYVRGMNLLNEAREKLFGRGMEVRKFAEAQGILGKLDERESELRAGSKSLHAELLKDAASSETLGMVNEALRILATIPERCLLDSSEREFITARIKQVETNPMVKAPPRRREWKARPVGEWRPWNPNPDAEPWEDEDPTVAGGKPKPAVGPVAPPPTLPPNPLFPMGRFSEEAMMFGLIETIRTGIEGGLLTGGRFFKRGTKNYLVSGATEEGLKLRDTETGLNTIAPWGQLKVTEIESLMQRVGGVSSENRLGLALLSFDRGEDQPARVYLVQYLKEVPDSKPGVDILLASREGRSSLPEGGYQLFEETILHPEVIEQVMFERKVAGLLTRFERGLGSRERSSARKESEAAFEELVALGPEAAGPAVKLLIGIKQKLMKEAESATGLSADTKALDALFDELEKRRKHALELIFDEQQWPYPYAPNNAEVTTEVMNRVEAVREVWNNPLAVKGVSNPKFEDLVTKIVELEQRMVKLDPNYAHHEPPTGEDVEYLRQIANERLSIRKYAKGSSNRTNLTRWIKVMEENDAVEKEWASKQGGPDKEAWEQLRITNDYRMMMGRHPLRMNFKLYWAAWHHSKWCVDFNGGQISHDSPGGPRGNNVPERCAFEGYTSGTGENIHMNSGQPSAQSAHDSWLRSSGHHRNILSLNWVVMGNGRYQTIWTQNFGNGDEGKSNQESKGGE